MALNTLFPRQRELVNYDYFDIAEGVGYVVYYGLMGNNAEYILSTSNNIFSDEICSVLKDRPIPITFTKKFDLDFDITFNRPKNIKGLIFANVPIGMGSTVSTGDKSYTYYVVVKAVHYAGNGETILATGTSRQVSEVAFAQDSRQYSSFVATCKMNVTTLKHFKKGETLRFIVEGWFKTGEGTEQSENMMLGHDPKNRNFRYDQLPGNLNINFILGNEPDGGGTIFYQNTQMIFHVPYVLDI